MAFTPYTSKLGALVATALLSISAWAQTATDMTNGEIRKVDKAASKITIKHDDIKNLEMPAMTMVFQVRDASLLDKVKAGDVVRFHAESQAGTYVVTRIEVTRK
jgi:Cu(I)/Ag(I) efflux system periplasmic protein CusF